MPNKLKLHILWRHIRPSKTNTKKDVLFIIGNWNPQVGSQAIPGLAGMFALGGQNEAGQNLTEFCQKNTLVIANTFFQQHKRRLYTWTSPDAQYRNQIGYILCNQRWRTSIQSEKNKTRSWLAQIINSYCRIQILIKSKKLWKTASPFRYDLSQITYNFFQGN